MKKIYIIIVIALVSSNVFGQAPNWAWAKSAGGTADDRGSSIATDAAGNTYITGYFSSPTITFGGTTLTNNGNYDIFIAKYDTTGNVVWAKSAGGTSSDYGYSIATDAAGNTYITGGFNSPTITFGTTTLTNADNTGSTDDIFIAKYDTNGNVVWANSAGGTAYDYGLSIATDAAGNTYITGYFDSPAITFGGTTLTNNGVADVFIAKYDTNGNVVWAKAAGGTGSDSGNSIATDAAGNTYITGYFSSPAITFGAIPLTNNGGYDIFIAEYDTNGNVVWAKAAGGTDYDEGGSIAADAAGNTYITGAFYSPAITFGGTTLTNNTNNGFTDIFIAEYDTNGNVVWAKAAGGPHDDVGFSIATDAAGNTYITGDFYSPAITFGGTTLTNTNNGYTDIFIAKLDAFTVGIEEQQDGGSFTIAPNPFTSAATITFSEEQKNTTIKVMNVLGECIQQLTTNNQQLTLDMSGYAKGVYFLSVNSQQGVVNRKIVKE